MRLIPLIVIVFLTINAKCGVVDNVYGRVKNTTSVIKDDIKGWFAAGKDLVFGDHTHDGEEQTENAHDCNHQVGDNEGIIKGLYRKVHDNVDNVKQKIHNIFTGSDDTQNHTSENTNHVESTTKENKVIGASNKVDSQNNQNNENTIKNEKTPTKPLENPSQDNMVDSDENLDIDIRDSFTAQGNKTVQNIKKDLEKVVENVKDNVRNTEQTVQRNVKDFQDKEKELLNKVSSNVKSNTDKLEKQANSFTEDLKKNF